MNSDLVNSLMTARTAQVSQSASIAVMRANQEMDLQLVQMVSEGVRPAPPPPGQGLKVDKHA